jgi:hypothetical protein
MYWKIIETKVFTFAIYFIWSWFLTNKLLQYEVFECLTSKLSCRILQLPTSTERRNRRPNQKNVHILILGSHKGKIIELCLTETKYYTTHVGGICIWYLLYHQYVESKIIGIAPLLFSFARLLLFTRSGVTQTLSLFYRHIIIILKAIIDRPTCCYRVNPLLAHGNKGR